ncbi:MAG: 8-oxoguanine deaminase [Anaerolineae bacterium]|nr:8-oxoguanine deaminase [Anaerolineae bacterium]
MPTLLLKNIHTLVTMDDQRREITDAVVLIRDNVIEAVGKSADLPTTADEVIDLRDHVVLPGLINTHHHMVQSLTRNYPPGQNAELFGWLQSLYPVWAKLQPEMIYVSALTAMSELMLSGCTTASDHLYIYPNGCKLDDQIQAATEIGIRFHASRGSMSLGESKGGLPPDRVVEDEEFILRDTRRLIEQYHDAKRHAMMRITVAPCSPFSVTQDLMREAAALARSYNVRLHTHLAENQNDVDYSQQMFGLEPADYAQDVGWVGDDVWHAHCVKLTDHGIGLFAHTHTGIAHCPSSNMRLASGIAPVRKMRDAGVRVGLGVDGSASNDSGHLLAEARMAMLLQRVMGDPAAMSARESLEIATRGGAQVLGRDDVGYLAAGMSADLIAFDLNNIAYAGGLIDPVAALLFCSPTSVNYSLINGRVVVREGQLTTIELPKVIQRHNQFSLQLMRGDD